jgi:hypothetical protein
MACPAYDGGTQICANSNCQCPTSDPGCAIINPSCVTQSFTLETLDPMAYGQYPFAIAVAPNGTIGVAYFSQTTPSVCPPDGGVASRFNYELRYVEENKPGAIAVVDTVQVPNYGVSLAYDSNNNPAIAYLGGQAADGMGASTAFCQSEAVVAYCNGGNCTDSASWVNGTSPNSVVIDTGTNDPCCTSSGGPFTCQAGVMDLGATVGVIGLWPCIVYNGTTAWTFFRDVHFGQFPRQDWGPSDIKGAYGAPQNWTKICELAFPSNQSGYGGMITCAIGNGGLPALAFTTFPGSAGSDEESNTAGVFFSQYLPDSGVSPSGFTWPGVELAGSGTLVRTGPRLAWDSQTGYGVVLEARMSTAAGSSVLNYFQSKTGATWNTTSPTQVYGGSGGWFPSITYRPDTHGPMISMYVCSNGVESVEPCPSPDKQVRVYFECGVAQGASWNFVVADALDTNDSVYRTEIGWTPPGSTSGDFFVVYRTYNPNEAGTQNGQLKIAKHK